MFGIFSVYFNIEADCCQRKMKKIINKVAKNAL